MDDYIKYISEFASAFMIVLSSYVIKLYKELLRLRDYKNKADVKIAKLEVENDFLLNKFFHKSHGKNREKLDD